MTRARNWIQKNQLISGLILFLFTAGVTGFITSYGNFVTLGADQAYMKSGFDAHVKSQGMQTKKFADNVKELGTRSAVIETKVNRIERDISEIKGDIKEILRSVR